MKIEVNWSTFLDYISSYIENKIATGLGRLTYPSSSPSSTMLLFFKSKPKSFEAPEFSIPSSKFSLVFIKIVFSVKHTYSDCSCNYAIITFFHHLNYVKHVYDEFMMTNFTLSLCLFLCQIIS